MAQIIKHRRGTAAQLKTTTLYKGELGVSTGSVAGVTTPILHVGDGTNAAGFVVGRLFQGSTVPTLNNGDIGTSLNDMLFHDSATYKLYRLNSSGNENLDLTGNIADRAITGSLTIGTSAANDDLLHVYGDISASGNIHAVGNITFEGGSSGTIELGSDAGDNVVLKADVSSSIIPNDDNTWDLGSSGQQWKDIWAKGTIDLNGTVDIDNDTTTIDSSGAISLDAGAASNFTTTAGAITIDAAASTVLVDGHTGVEITSTNSGVVTIDGKAGVTVQEDGTDVIAIDTNRDVLFSQTGGSTADPDVEFDGYVRFDGVTEVANDTETSGSGTGAFQVDGGVNIAKGLTVGGYAIIDGNLTVKGTQTYVSSSVVDIGDNIINLNALGAAADGGIQVLDASGSAHTGSMLWNAADDYWYSGISGSTHYRVPQQSTNAAFAANKVLITDANGRLETSDNITDNDTTVDFNDVDLTSIDKLEGVDANTYIDIGGSTLIVTKGTLQPASNGGDDLGATGTRYANLWLSANADIDGTLDVQGLADFQAKVHAQAGLEVTGSAFISAGASVEATGSNVGSYVAFRNESNTQLGYLDPAMTSVVTSGVIGYNESKQLVVSNVIDGGSF